MTVSIFINKFTKKNDETFSKNEMRAKKLSKVVGIFSKSSEFSLLW